MSFCWVSLLVSTVLLSSLILFSTLLSVSCTTVFSTFDDTLLFITFSVLFSSLTTLLLTNCASPIFAIFSNSSSELAVWTAVLKSPFVEKFKYPATTNIKAITYITTWFFFKNFIFIFLLLKFFYRLQRNISFLETPEFCV